MASSPLVVGMPESIESYQCSIFSSTHYCRSLDRRLYATLDTCLVLEQALDMCRHCTGAAKLTTSQSVLTGLNTWTPQPVSM